MAPFLYLLIQCCRNQIVRGQICVLFCSSAVDCTQTFLFRELLRTASRVSASLSQPLLLVWVSPKQNELCSLDKQLPELTRSRDCRSIEQLQFDDCVPELRTHRHTRWSRSSRHSESPGPAAPSFSTDEISYARSLGKENSAYAACMRISAGFLLRSSQTARKEFLCGTF